MAVTNKDKCSVQMARRGEGNEQKAAAEVAKGIEEQKGLLVEQKGLSPTQEFVDAFVRYRFNFGGQSVVRQCLKHLGVAEQAIITFHFPLIGIELAHTGGDG